MLRGLRKATMSILGMKHIKLSTNNDVNYLNIFLNNGVKCNNYFNIQNNIYNKYPMGSYDF